VGGPIEGTGAGRVRNDNAARIAMTWIPAGKFRMGSPTTEKDRFFNEEQAVVTLAQGFWIGKYEVTQGQWRALMKTSPWHALPNVQEGSDYPATFVSWEDAMKFCNALTKASRGTGQPPAGWEYALPTHAQWEYACRAGTTTRYSFGNADSELAEYAWYGDNSGEGADAYAHRVGQKRPNPWGLYDVHGNVAEWCVDEDRSKPETDFQRAQYAAYGQPRVIVGGSWLAPAQSCRSAFNSAAWKSDRSAYLGFRVALLRLGSNTGSANALRHSKGIE
jgi:formylglycine-generating enzyme required for sulfatase activity